MTDPNPDPDGDRAVADAAWLINQVVFGGRASPQEAIRWGVIDAARAIAARLAVERQAAEALAVAERDAGATVN